jgi:hypothetical protein
LEKSLVSSALVNKPSNQYDINVKIDVFG